MIHAYISDHMFGDIAISIVIDTAADSAGPAQRRIMRLGDNRSFELIESGIVTAPTLTLDDDMARALLDALTRHYHGAEDTRMLRRDYDDERKRADKLTSALLQIAIHASGSRTRNRHMTSPIYDQLTKENTMTNHIADIRGKIDEGVHGIEGWITAFKTHLPELDAEVARITSTPLFKAAEAAVLTPAEEAIVTGIIGALVSLRPAVAVVDDQGDQPAA